jgi:signal peptidase I
MSQPINRKPSTLRVVWRWLRPVVITALVVFAFRSTVLDWNVVPTGSMNPTIVEGDWVLVNKLAYDFKVPLLGRTLFRWGGPQRGDIVIFDPPGEKDRFVKRVVAVPGDVVELRDNQLFLNGKPARYSPLSGEQGPPTGDWLGQETISGRSHLVHLTEGVPSPSTFGPVTVPPGHYFMLGDNRDNSKDSRYFGFVARERIVGRVGRVLLSLDPLAVLHPRWARFGLALL